MFLRFPNRSVRRLLLVPLGITIGILGGVHTSYGSDPIDDDGEKKDTKAHAVYYQGKHVADECYGQCSSGNVCCRIVKQPLPGEE